LFAHFIILFLFDFMTPHLGNPACRVKGAGENIRQIAIRQRQNLPVDWRFSAAAAICDAIFSVTAAD
jgi:hypothetical protein